MKASIPLQEIDHEAMWARRTCGNMSHSSGCPTRMATGSHSFGRSVHVHIQQIEAQTGVAKPMHSWTRMRLAVERPFSLNAGRA